MRITNLNPDTDIGASAWLAEVDGHRILLDAGTHPKREGRPSLPLYDLVKKTDVDAIAISHCHHDHVGSLPVALRHFPQAHVLMPELSYFLIERVLHNSVNVMIRQRDELGLKEYPLYSHAEVDEIAPCFKASNTTGRWTGRRSEDARRFCVADPGILRCRARARVGGHPGSRQQGDPVLHRRRLFSRPDDSEGGAVRQRPGRCDDHGNDAGEPGLAARVQP